jgi:hypothetical protein
MRGCAVLEGYAGTRRGHPFELVRLFTVSTEQDHRLQVGVADSEHGPLYSYDARSDEGAISFHLSIATPNGTVLLRLRYTNITASSFVVENARSVDGGKTWDATGRAEYRRR